MQVAVKQATPTISSPKSSLLAWVGTWSGGCCLIVFVFVYSLFIVVVYR